MYTTYTTDAIIFAREGVGEADARLEVFTKDFGVVRARAAGARAEESKLRYALQTFSYSRIALVRGVRGWRLTGADVLHKPQASAHPQHTARFARVVTLIRALLAADEPSPDVFDVCAAHAFSLADDQAELVLVASILTILGYLTAGDYVGTAALHAYWAQRVADDRTQVLDTVNNALSANHIAQR